MFDYIDQWPLYAGTRNLGRFLYIADKLREILSVPGDVAEFGSWRGANVVFMAKLIEIFCPHSPKKIHCFEGFEGLTTFANQDGDSVKHHGEYKGDLQELLEIIKLYKLEHRIEIHKGLIQETVPQFISIAPTKMFSFIYFDADLYEPAKVVLDGFFERLSVGGLILFDEWNDERWPGETKAVSEFFDGRADFKMTSPSYTLQPSLVIQKTLKHYDGVAASGGLG